jgi:hypothetical protein
MKAHMIALKYNYEPSNGNKHVTAGKDDANKYEDNYTVIPDKTKLSDCNDDDTLEFCCDQGYVTVKLTPADMFSPDLFSTDPSFCDNNNITAGTPVTIKKRGKFKYCCGFSVGYPSSEKLGNNGED